MVELPRPGEDADAPLAPAGQYVAVTVSGETNFGDDCVWRTPGPAATGLLKRLQAPLVTAGVVCAYTRRMPPRGSVTVLLPRLVSV